MADETRGGSRSTLREKEYRQQLRQLWIELVKLQRHLIEDGRRLLVLLEGRDAAGKDGVIKRIVRHLSPRETRVFAPSRPSDRERSSWYFQRFVPHLPSGGEFVLFNRSWYNRAGVERVMGYCTEAECEAFLRDVSVFEAMLARDGIELRKYYLDLSREEQQRRMDERRGDPLKQWKISPVDDRALELWEPYGHARDVMLRRTDTDDAPWQIVSADDKRRTRLSIMSHLLASLDYPGKDDAAILAVDGLARRYEIGASLAS